MVASTTCSEGAVVAVAERIGLVTIGQAPRDDIVPGFLRGFGGPAELVQTGALDGLDAARVEALAPRPGDQVLVTRMKDGRPVTVGRESLVPLVQAAIDRVERAPVDLICVLCTGTFPELKAGVPLLEPDRLVFNLARGILPSGRLGVVIPLAEQVEQATERWSAGWSVLVRAALPYGPKGEIDGAVRRFHGFGPDLMVLDCLGFTPEDGLRAREILGRPVLVPQTILGRVAAEIVGV